MSNKVDNFDLIKGLLGDAIEVLSWMQEVEPKTMEVMPMNKPISMDQLRAARAMLRLRCTDLGDLAKVAGPTVSRAETGYALTKNMWLTLRVACEEQGVIFYANGAVGMKK
jgi:hypothetical protein